MRELYAREKIALPNGKRIRLIKELIECGALDEFFLEEVLPEHADAGLQRYLQLWYIHKFYYSIFIRKSFYSS